MTAASYALFDTALGRCGVAWGPDGVVALQLPESGDAETVRRLRRRAPGASPAPPPPDVRRAVAAVVALLSGVRTDLSFVRLDLSRVPAFERRVYEAARAIAPGETRTYGEIAALAGEPGGARAVGRAMGRNPFPIVVPCHRVVAAAGRSGGFSARGGVSTKLRMLAIERAWAAAPLFRGRP